MRFADLHLHTSHSDGARSPREVVELASQHGLDIIAISDHDNLAAIDEAIELARPCGIVVISAVELSSNRDGVDVHLLGYGFDHHDAALRHRLEYFQRARRERGLRMIERLIASGCSIRRERVLELCTGASLGRPHIARALVEAGEVQTISEAFARWLGPGCPGHVEKERFPPAEAIEIIHRTGGMISVAHPTLYPDGEAVVRSLFDLGADAVEAIHPEVDSRSRKQMENLARDYGKFVTGGSDDHGLGDLRAIGSIRVPETAIAPLLELVEGSR